MRGERNSRVGSLPHRENFLIFILIINLLCLPALALDFDTSLDNEARKNYTPSKTEEDYVLPALPKALNEAPPSTSSTPSNIKEIIPISSDMKPIPKSQIKHPNINYKQPVKLSAESYAVLKQGTKIKVKLLNNISDKSKKGTKIEFVSKYPVSTTYFTIPMGTIFKGEIINSHKPQFTGNGGLIVIRINSMVLNGETQPIETHVIKANSKKVFFNNIKGKRKYISSMFQAMKPGTNFFKKMLGVSANLATDGSSILVSPFSLALGVIGFGGNVCAAPVIAVFHKGDPISIPEGNNFEIKLLQDVFIYK